MKPLKVKFARLRKEEYETSEGVGERWLVFLGKKFTGTKSQKKRFPDYDLAKKWLLDEVARREKQGSSAFELTPLQVQHARGAFKMLEEAKVTASLEEVVSYYLKREKPTGGTLTLSAAITAYEGDKKMEGRSKHYLDRQLGTVKQFAKVFGAADCQDVVERDCRKWLFETKSNLAQNGRRHYHADLSAFFAWLLEKRYVGVNPWDHVPRPDRVPTKTEILSPLQAKRLLSAASSTRHLAAVVLGLFCGVRTAEIKRLTWADIRLGDEPCVILEAAVTKKKRRRVVELKATAIKWLDLIPVERRQGLVASASVEDRLTELYYRVQTEFPDFKYGHNAMRHSFASYAYVAFGLEWVVSALGHNGDTSTFKEHYQALASKKHAAEFWGILPSARDQNSAIAVFDSSELIA